MSRRGTGIALNDVFEKFDIIAPSRRIVGTYPGKKGWQREMEGRVKVMGKNRSSSFKVYSLQAIPHNAAR